MRGLLTKDFTFYKNQRQFIIIILIVGFLLMLGNGKNGLYNVDYTFCISYITTALTVLSINTISYDECDNGLAHIFTLPITRKQYVLEKYVLSLITMMASLIITAIAVLLFSDRLINGEEWFEAMVITVGISVVFLSLMIPLNIKFGAQKARTALFAMIAIVYSIAYILLKASGILKINLSGIDDFMARANTVTATITCIAAYIIIMVSSYFISVKIIEKKEY